MTASGTGLLPPHNSQLRKARFLCKGTYRAISEFTGQNGKLYNTNPVLTNSCKGNRTAHNDNANKRSPR